MIANGEKTVELRLNDEKRQKIKVGDSIIFINQADQSKTVAAVVAKLTYAATFNELLRIIPHHAAGADDQALLQALRHWYPESEEKKYGALGIHLSLR